MIKKKTSFNEYFRKAKIIATIGPKTDSTEELEKLIQAGVSIFRLNFSHDGIDIQGPKADKIKELGKKYGRHITFFADLQGPKLRLGTFKDGSAEIKDGQKFIVDSNPEEGDSNRVYLPHPDILKALKAGDKILIDDGKLQLEVVKNCGDSCETKVLVGGIIKNKKGFNLPDTILKSSCLTEKDKKDLADVKKYGFDWVAVSFVQTPEDVMDARKLIGDDTYLILKLERPSAVADENLEKMVELADCIMVARGDLGVELGAWRVPAAQKKIIAMCAKVGRPVIVATQMLESMIEIPFPTRAEATDVANAIFEGADCVMLSAETATGKYPDIVVQTMNNIIVEAETSPQYPEYMNMFLENIEYSDSISDAMYEAAVAVSDSINAKAIVCLTGSGTSAINLSHLKPNAPIIAIAPDDHTAAKLGFCGGVLPIVAEANLERQEDLESFVSKIVKEEFFADKGDNVVLVLGRNSEESKILFKKGTTNMLSVLKVS